MKLFHCTACGEYYDTAHGSAVVNFLVEDSTIAIRDDKLYIEFESNIRVCEPLLPAIEIKESLCARCDAPAVEIVDVDTCPHHWHESPVSERRHCLWCSEKQVARLVWPDEVLR